MIQKVGILTWHYYKNFGSQLQTYALVKMVRNMGIRCCVLNYRNPKFGKSTFIKQIIQRLALILPEKIAEKVSNRLKLPELRFRSYFEETALSFTTEGLALQSKNFDVIVCGSDQIWAPNVFNPIYMLNFVGSGIRKVSYAASIGLNDIPSQLVDSYRRYLSSFHFISVREEKGKQLLKDKCGLDSSVVLDPTLMINVDHWCSIAVRPKIQEDYIFCYFLNKNHNYSRHICEFAAKTSLNVYTISENPEDNVWSFTLSQAEIGPKEFIGLIANAHTVITDSYHGTIFSLLFHKRFLTLERFKSSDEISQNSRIQQLDKYFGIGVNIVNPLTVTELIPRDMDWDEFEKKLSNLRILSLNYLKIALE